MKCLFKTLFAPDEIWRKKSLLVLSIMLFSVLHLAAQNIEVKGTITDGMTNEPLPGVNIIVEGSSIGAVSDALGKYSISVPSGDVTLVFSFIGYTSQKVSVQGRTIIDITLEMASNQLDEVVTIGYGKVKKKDLTGSVASIKGETLKAQQKVHLMLKLRFEFVGVVLLHRIILLCT